MTCADNSTDIKTDRNGQKGKEENQIKCIKCHVLRFAGQKYDLSINILDPPRTVYRVLARGVQGAGTHQLPAGKNGPEILKFHGGGRRESEVGRSEARRRVTRPCCPARPPRPPRRPRRSPPPRIPTGAGSAAHRRRTAYRLHRTAGLS